MTNLPAETKANTIRTYLERPEFFRKLKQFYEPKRKEKK